MSNGSSIPGAKPPRVAVKRKETDPSLLLDLTPSVSSSQSSSAPEIAEPPSNRVDAILNRPTSDIIQETGEVISWTTEEAKTVGGLGLIILTVCALVAASPWSWLSMLLFGPARVWGFFYAGVLGGVGTALGLVLGIFLLASVVVAGGIVWLIVRATAA